VTLAQAALTEPLAVVHKALRRLGSRTQDDRPRRCAVVGAGTIGHLTARVLALRGHTVTVFDAKRDRLALLNDVIQTSMSLEGLDQFDWTIEATGQQSVLSTLLQRCSTGATLLLLGLPYSYETFSFESIVAYDRSVLGSVGSSGADFEQALATLAQIDTTPFLGTSYPLKEYEKAWAMVRTRSVLKVMLKADATAV
jgi:threonine dehydrogenase-like Zn-dependent dehydrogenase